jgi:hypothetical protein
VAAGWEGTPNAASTVPFRHFNFTVAIEDTVIILLSVTTPVTGGRYALASKSDGLQSLSPGLRFSLRSLTKNRLSIKGWSAVTALTRRRGHS